MASASPIVRHPRRHSIETITGNYQVIGGVENAAGLLLKVLQMHGDNPGAAFNDNIDEVPTLTPQFTRVRAPIGASVPLMDDVLGKA
jgi:hypothetical protein